MYLSICLLERLIFLSDSLFLWYWATQTVIKFFRLILCFLCIFCKYFHVLYLLFSCLSMYHVYVWVCLCVDEKQTKEVNICLYPSYLDIHMDNKLYLIWKRVMLTKLLTQLFHYWEVGKQQYCQTWGKNQLHLSYK